MDIIDAGSEREMADTEAAVRAARAKAERLEAEATGYCLACNSSVPEGHRWCDVDCRSDYERYRKALKRAGIDQ